MSVVACVVLVYSPSHQLTYLRSFLPLTTQEEKAEYEVKKQEDEEKEMLKEAEAARTKAFQNKRRRATGAVGRRR